MAEEVKFFKVKDYSSVGTTDGIYFIKKDSSNDFELMVIDKGSKKFSEYICKSKSNTVTDDFSMQQENGAYVSIASNGLKVGFGGISATYGTSSISVDNLTHDAAYKFQELLFPKRAVKNVEEKVYPVTYVQGVKADETGRVDISGVAMNWTNSHTFSKPIEATSFYESSLKKYKKNIKPYNSNALGIINSLNIVTYDRTDTNILSKIGIIADDSHKDMLNEGCTAVDLYKTVFVLAKSIQELNAKIKELEKQK